MRYLLAPDSYKGSLSALQAAKAMGRGVRKADSSAECILMPVADGGEGTVQALVEAMNGRIIEQTVTGPLGDPIPSFFGVFPDGKTAVIEMASASGLTLVPKEKRNPLITTTLGTGELIKAALDKGYTKIIVGMGGSATNDGGAGMAQALGYRFLDDTGHELPLGGGSLSHLHHIDGKNRDPRLDEAEIIAACDVESVLCGENGASAIFGPQKGANSIMVAQLEHSLSVLEDKIHSDLGISVKSLKGGGAAGGLGAGIVAFAGGRLEKGIDLVLDLCKFDLKASQSDLVFTGEGNTDHQTVMGKAPVGIARIAKKYSLPVICISGGLGEGYQQIYEHGIDAAFSIMPFPAPLDEACKRAEEWIEDTVESVVRLYGHESRNHIKRMN